jgi:hypothetical protein
MMVMHDDDEWLKKILQFLSRIGGWLGGGGWCVLELLCSG